MLFRLCLFITQKVLNFHASFTWSERWYSAHVFFKDANDRVTETSEALEEERRLLYVAITRAKEELYISLRNFRGKKLDISRFYIQCERFT